MNDNFTTNSFLLVSKHDGKETYQYPFGKNTDDALSIVAYREQGLELGKHYHKGLSPTKDPEKLILLSGKIILETIHIQTLENKTVELTAPVEILINKMVWHKVTSLTPIIFVELNSLDEHIADTFYDFVPAITT